jgi:hypothetical protein
MQRQEQKQIPFGDDKQRGNTKAKRQRQDQRGNGKTKKRENSGARRYSGTCQPAMVWARVRVAVPPLAVASAMAGKAA